MIFAREVVWTPRLVRDGIAIGLNREFALACAKLPYAQDDANFLKTRLWELVTEDRAKVMPSNFLMFFQNSLLLEAIYLNPGAGVWLELERSALKSNPIEALTYYGHNAEHLLDRYNFMEVFGTWASGAGALLNKN